MRSARSVPRAPDGHFDERVAADYDESSAEMFAPGAVDPVVDFLAGLSGGRPGHGIDLSRAMVARLHAKPGGDAIPVTIGDFAATTVDSTFSVAYLVFNTISNLTTQAAQVGCFRNAAAHLAVLRERERWAYDVYDVATQSMSSNHVDVVDGRGRFRSIPFRYTSPAELDLMAELARLRLSERWGRVDQGAVHEREPPARLRAAAPG